MKHSKVISRDPSYVYVSTCEMLFQKRTTIHCDELMRANGDPLMCPSAAILLH